jgi:hypothetical protein
MKWLGILLMIWGIYSGFKATKGMLTGVTQEASRATTYLEVQEKDPEGFQRLINYQWVKALLYIGAGVFVLGIERKWKANDIMSPDFHGGDQVSDESSASDTKPDHVKKKDESP